MTGLAIFAKKEAREILRTWRIWVLPGIVLLFALSGPLLARFTPELVQSLAGSQLHGLKIPAPTYADSYAQWVKNLTQIVLIAVIIVYGGIVSGEVRSGTAALVLTKPLSRVTFVYAKAAVHSVFLALLVAAGALLTWLLTRVIFGAAPAAPLWSATGAFLVLGALFICVMAAASVLIGSAAGAAGAGLAAFAILSIAAIWKPLGTYSPAGLPALPGSLAGGHDASALWPLLTSVVLGVALVALAGLVFRRRDL